MATHPQLQGRRVSKQVSGKRRAAVGTAGKQAVAGEEAAGQLRGLPEARLVWARFGDRPVRDRIKVRANRPRQLGSRRFIDD